MPEDIKPEVKISDQEVESAREIKRKADLKRNIVTAIEQRDVRKVVESLQIARRYLLQIDKNDNSFSSQRVDSLHAEKGGWWEQLFTDFFQKVEEQERRGKIPDLDINEQVHLDAVNRSRIGVRQGKPFIQIIGGTISAPEVVFRWRLIEQAYDIYYGENRNLISDEARALVEGNSPK